MKIYQVTLKCKVEEVLKNANPKFVDIQVVSKDHRRFATHKIVLASASDFLSSLLSDVNDISVVLFDQVSGNILKNFLSLIYTGESQSLKTKQELRELKDLCERLKIKLGDSINTTVSDSNSNKKFGFREVDPLHLIGEGNSSSWNQNRVPNEMSTQDSSFGFQEIDHQQSGDSDSLNLISNTNSNSRPKSNPNDNFTFKEIKIEPLSASKSSNKISNSNFIRKSNSGSSFSFHEMEQLIDPDSTNQISNSETFRHSRTSLNSERTKLLWHRRLSWRKLNQRNSI